MGVILKMIKSKNDMSSSECSVLEYLLKYKHETIRYNIGEIARKSSSSAASVVRMCKKLGYRGYKDFKIDFITDLESENDYELSNEDTILADNEDYLDIVVRKNIKVLEETLELVSKDDINDAVKTITNADNILVFGKGASYIVAQDLEMKFLRINKPIRSIEDSHNLLVAITYLKTKDVIILISHSGETEEIIKACLAAKEMNIKIISIVKYGTSTLSKASDIVLYTTSYESEFRSGAMTSRMSQLCVVDMLYTAFAFSNRDFVVECLNKSIKLLHKYKGTKTR